MKTRLQIILTNPAAERSYDGRKYTTQDAECIVINENGTPSQVGVLRLSRDYTDVVAVKDGVTSIVENKAPKPGLYDATFGLVVSPKDRKIGAAIVELQPVRAASASGAATPASK